MNKTYNSSMIWNKAKPANISNALLASAKEANRRISCPIQLDQPNNGVLLPTGAALFFNPIVDGKVLRGFWVKSYASSGIDSKPYCYA